MKCQLSRLMDRSDSEWTVEGEFDALLHVQLLWMQLDSSGYSSSRWTSDGCCSRCTRSSFFSLQCCTSACLIVFFACFLLFLLLSGRACGGFSLSIVVVDADLQLLAACCLVCCSSLSCCAVLDVLWGRICVLVQPWSFCVCCRTCGVSCCQSGFCAAVVFQVSSVHAEVLF